MAGIIRSSYARRSGDMQPLSMEPPPTFSGRPARLGRGLRIAVLAGLLRVTGGWRTVSVPRHSGQQLPLCMRHSGEPRAAVVSAALEQSEVHSRGPASASTDALPNLHLPSNGEDASTWVARAPERSQQHTVAVEHMTPEMQRKHTEMLDRAYEACRSITEQYAKTFYFGTKFFSEEKRSAVWAVYAWCRRLDDIVDKPRKDTSSLRQELAQWKQRLEDIFKYGRAWDILDLALVDTVKRYPDLSITPFEDMIKGMVMDLDQNRFETFDELYVYCYRVAGTVGLMTMPIMGTAPDYTADEALEPALALGVALQLTNILRDVGEDRVRQRIYIPQEDLRRFNVSEASLLKGIKDEKYVALTKFQIARAREWYKRAEEGIAMLAEDARLPVRASLDMYSTILNKIEQNEYDNFNKRAYTAKWEKVLMLPRAWMRVQDTR